MKTLSLAAFCLLAAVAAFAVETPPLERVYAGASQGFKPQAAALKRSVKANADKAAAATPVRKFREFHLEYERGFWRMIPNPNPPGTRLTIDVDAGDRVRLDLVNASWGREDSAQFLIDGIDATVNGKPSRGIEVWLASAGDSATVEFNAGEPGIHPINRSLSVGSLVIRKR